MTNREIQKAVKIAQRVIELSRTVSLEYMRNSAELVTLGRAVLELSRKVNDMTCTGDCIHNCNCMTAVELKEELDALKEKYRWRKQSEEPAPDDIVEIEIYDIGANVFYVPEGKVHIPGNRYWRPLDLPEMGETK